MKAVVQFLARNLKLHIPYVYKYIIYKIMVIIEQVVTEYNVLNKYTFQMIFKILKCTCIFFLVIIWFVPQIYNEKKNHELISSQIIYLCI